MTETFAPSDQDQSCECDKGGWSRRQFLKGVGVGGATLVAGTALSARAAYAQTATWGGPILLVLSLRGGFDGLSAVAPLGDPDYARKRPTIAVPTSTALPTGDLRFGLHPALKPLKPLWDSGMMAAVHAVGTPDTSRSHFAATRELERAAPGSSLRTGWLDRVLGAAGTGTVFEGVQLGSGNPSALLNGAAPVLAATTLKNFTLNSADWAGPRMADTIRALSTDNPLPGAAPTLLSLSALTAANTAVTADAGVGNGAAYPTNNPLAAALADAAVLIRSNVGLQALSIDVGDWDMHSALGPGGTGWMAKDLGSLAAALAAFAADLGSLMSRVTVVTISEFGRRVAENGSGGVDHGHGNAVLLLGGGLNGGQVHGTWPGLSDAALDQGDLAGTTDYRDILADCLTTRMGMPTSTIATTFPGLTHQSTGVFA